MRRHLVLLMVLVMAGGGCRKGPDEDRVTARLQADLDKHFGQGTLVVEELDRRGSHPLSLDGDERARLLTYFDVTIRLGSDYDFAGWDDPNAGSLANLLGASSQGVAGIQAGGNAAGDRLEVHGAVAWVRGDGDWEQAPFAPEAAARKGPPDSEEPEPYRKELAAIGEVGARLTRKGGDAAGLTRDLGILRTRYDMAAARLEGKVTLATADPTGFYHPIGLRLAEALADAGTPAAAFPTAGSGANLDLLKRGVAQLAIVQSDLAKDGPRLRALGALFPEAVQVLVTEASGIAVAGELRGRRVATGLPGSGAYVDALRLFQAAELGPDAVKALRTMPLADAEAALLRGEVDALILTTAYPSPLVQRAAAAGIRLASLGPRTVARMRTLEPAMILVRIPGGTYAGQEAPVETVGVTALLVTTAAAPDGLVRQVVDLVWGDKAALAGAGSGGAMISRVRRTAGVTIPFHPAASQKGSGSVQ